MNKTDPRFPYALQVVIGVITISILDLSQPELNLHVIR